MAVAEAIKMTDAMVQGLMAVMIAIARADGDPDPDTGSGSTDDGQCDHGGGQRRAEKIGFHFFIFPFSTPSLGKTPVLPFSFRQVPLPENRREFGEIEPSHRD